MVKIGLEKIRDVKSPSKGTSGSAGYDFYVPEDLGRIKVQPGEDVLIPSGLKVVEFSGGFMVMDSRSSESSSRKAKALCGLKPKCSIGNLVVDGVIDEDYRGEILLHVRNMSRVEIAVIEPGHKIAQGLLFETPEAEMTVYKEGTMYVGSGTGRGDGGFGSTNN